MELIYFELLFHLAYRLCWGVERFWHRLFLSYRQLLARLGRRRSRWQYGTAVLTTAGGLVFVGDIDRHMYALDARDGTELWHTRTPTATDGFPITYAVAGRQYLAVPSGPGWSIAWRNARQAFPEDMQRPPGGGSVLQVFALP